MLTLSLSHGLTDQLLRRGAVHKAERPGSDYHHILAYLKTQQDIKAGTSCAVHVAVTKPQNFADLEKSELYPRRPDETGWLLPEVSLTEAETDFDPKSDDEEAGRSGTFSGKNVGLDKTYANDNQDGPLEAPQGSRITEGEGPPMKDSLTTGGKNGKQRAGDAADNKT